jgi:hypothetical protein
MSSDRHGDFEASERERSARARLEQVVSLLDDRYRIPGTPIRFGLDAILGFIPVAGDLLGAALSLWVLAEAVRLRAPRSLLTRMVGNVLVEFGVGAVPLVGDLFDVWWKANRRNLDLLKTHLDREQKSTAPSRRGVRAAFVLAGAALCIAAVLVARWISGL